MNKIPVLFERQFLDNHDFILTDKVTPGFEWVLKGEGIPTIKFDGSCTAVIDSTFYKRFDAKSGRTIPPGSIPCCLDPDPITGHWPHWALVSPVDNMDKWYVEAYVNTRTAFEQDIEDGTYEAIGPHFQKNPYNLTYDRLIKHGSVIIDDLFDRSFNGIKKWLEEHNEEGIVFWKDGKPQCKIRRKDFHIKWEGYENKLEWPSEKYLENFM